MSESVSLANFKAKNIYMCVNLYAHSWDQLDDQLVKSLQQILSTHSYLVVWQQ